MMKLTLKKNVKSEYYIISYCEIVNIVRISLSLIMVSDVLDKIRWWFNEIQLEAIFIILI